MDADAHEPEQTVSLGQITAALRRQGRIAVAGALFGAFAAGGLTLAAPASYTATAVVALTALPDNPLSSSTTARAVNTATEIEIVRSTAVAEKAAASLHTGEAVGTLIGRVSVSTPQDSAVLRITFSDSNPAAAAAGANAFAQTYLAYRSDLAQSRITTAAGALDSRLNDLVAQRSAANAAAASASTEAARTTATNRAANLSSLIGDLEQQRAKLNNPTLGSAGDLVGHAEPPAAPTGRGPTVMIIAGTAMGLVLGLLLALLWDRRGHRVRDRHQVQAHSGAPVLASVPLDDDPSAAPARAEAYRRLAVIAAAAARDARGTALGRGDTGGRLVLAGAGAQDGGEAAGRLAGAIGAHVGPNTPTTLLCPAPSVAAGRRAAALQAGARVPIVLPLDDLEPGAAPVAGGAGLPGAGGPGLPESGQDRGQDGGLLIVDAVSTDRRSTALALLTPGTPVLVLVRLGETRVEELERVVADVRAAGATVTGVVVQYPPRRRWGRGRRPGASTSPSPAAHLAASDRAPRPVAPGVLVSTARRD